MSYFHIVGTVPASALYDMLEDVYGNSASTESNRERKVKTGKVNKPRKVKKYASK